jgi:hypothetical protein
MPRFLKVRSSSFETASSSAGKPTARNSFMSLTDAFLLDPAPFNVWIAYRGDGAGSGTANDPYDGSPRCGTPRGLTNLSKNGSVATATVQSGETWSNGTAGVIEGNAVYDARYACYADTGSNCCAYCLPDIQLYLLQSGDFSAMYLVLCSLSFSVHKRILRIV